MKDKETIESKELNQEGRVGTIETIDVHSDAFQKLKSKIKAEYEELSESEKLKIEFESLKQKIIAYLEDEHPNQIKYFDYFVKKYLDVLGLKQKELAEFIDYNPTNLSKVLKGKRPLNYELAFKIAESFELDPELLLMVQMKNHLMEQKHKKLYSSDELISFSKNKRKSRDIESV